MSTFDESKHNRGGDGKFGPKEQTAVDFDLTPPRHFSEEITRWEDVEEAIVDVISWNEGDWDNTTIDSALEHIGATPGEAAQSFGPNRARWLAAVHTSVEYERTGWRDLEGQIQDEEVNRQAVFSYIDPHTGRSEELCTVEIDGEHQCTETPDIMSHCPFGEDDELKGGVDLPPQFTEEGEADLQPWIDAEVNMGHAREWKRLGVDPGVAAHWQGTAFVNPQDYPRKKKHKTPEAAVQAQIIEKATVEIRLADLRLRSAQSKTAWLNHKVAHGTVSPRNAEVQEAEIREVVDKWARHRANHQNALNRATIDYDKLRKKT